MSNISSTYKIGNSLIWMIIHLDPDANVTAVEDHDNNAGGHIQPQHNESYEQLFVRSARTNGFAQYDIENFLKNSKEQTRQKNPNRPTNIAYMLDRIPVEHLKAALARRPTE